MLRAWTVTLKAVPEVAVVGCVPDTAKVSVGAATGHGLAMLRVGPVMQISVAVPVTVSVPPPGTMQFPVPVSVIVFEPAVPNTSAWDWLFENVPDPCTRTVRLSELQPAGASCMIRRAWLLVPTSAGRDVGAGGETRHQGDGDEQNDDAGTHPGRDYVSRSRRTPRSSLHLLRPPWRCAPDGRSRTKGPSLPRRARLHQPVASEGAPTSDAG